MSSVTRFRKGEDVQLTKDFHLSEFECKCNYDDCDHTLIDLDHVQKLQDLRDKYGRPVRVNCGFRCAKHNKDVGGVEKSQHVNGTATDFDVIGVPPAEVQDDCEDFTGLGRYKTFTHTDSRPGKKARWGSTPHIPEAEAKPEYLPKGPTEEEINKRLEQIEDLIKKIRGA